MVRRWFVIFHFEIKNQNQEFILPVQIILMWSFSINFTWNKHTYTDTDTKANLTQAFA